MVRPGRLPPNAMFPAEDARFRQYYLPLPSGLRVRAVECGPADGPPLVLFPGWGSSAYLFRGILPPLGAAGLRAIVVEPKGHGLSDKPTAPGSYSTDAMVAHVRDIADGLGFDGVMLGGHSLGSAFAARAAAGPLRGRVRSLILLAPVGTNGLPWRRLFRLVTVRPLRRLLPRLVTQSLVRLFLVIGYGDRSRRLPARDVDEYWAPSQFPEFAPAMSDLLRDTDWGDEQPFSFGDAPVPTLVVYGTRDHLVRRTRVIEEARRWPHVRIVPIPGGGHIVTDEMPERVARAITEFLDCGHAASG